MKKCSFFFLFLGVFLMGTNARAESIEPSDMIECTRPSPVAPRSIRRGVRPSLNQESQDVSVITSFIILRDPNQTGERNIIGAIRAPNGSIEAFSPERACQVGADSISCQVRGQPEILISIHNQGPVRARVGGVDYPCTLSPYARAMSRPNT